MHALGEGYMPRSSLQNSGHFDKNSVCSPNQTAKNVATGTGIICWVQKCKTQGASRLTRSFHSLFWRTRMLQRDRMIRISAHIATHIHPLTLGLGNEPYVTRSGRVVKPLVTLDLWKLMVKPSGCLKLKLIKPSRDIFSTIQKQHKTQLNHYTKVSFSAALLVSPWQSHEIQQYLTDTSPLQAYSLIAFVIIRRWGSCGSILYRWFTVSLSCLWWNAVFSYPLRYEFLR